MLKMKKLEIDLESTNFTLEVESTNMKLFCFHVLPARNEMHKDKGVIVNFNYR